MKFEIENRMRTNLRQNRGCIPIVEFLTRISMTIEASAYVVADRPRRLLAKDVKGRNLLSWYNSTAYARAEIRVHATAGEKRFHESCQRLTYPPMEPVQEILVTSTHLRQLKRVIVS